MCVCDSHVRVSGRLLLFVRPALSFESSSPPCPPVVSPPWQIPASICSGWQPWSFPDSSLCLIGNPRQLSSFKHTRDLRTQHPYHRHPLRSQPPVLSLGFPQELPLPLFCHFPLERKVTPIDAPSDGLTALLQTHQAFRPSLGFPCCLVLLGCPYSSLLGTPERLQRQALPSSLPPPGGPSHSDVPKPAGERPFHQTVPPSTRGGLQGAGGGG